MSKVTSEYVMFCDQDDIWLPEKIENSIIKIHQSESIHGKLPILIYSDATIVNENCETLAKSFYKYEKLNYEWAKNINISKIQNTVLGCTVMINKSALSLSQPIGNNAIMHDWWILLKVLQNDGKIIFINEPTILYRQHLNNTMGSKKFSFFGLLKKAKDINKYKKMNKDLGFDDNELKLLFWKFLVIFLRLLK